MSVRVPVWVPSFDEVMAGRSASAAEEALLEACRTNGWAWVGEGCPDDTSDPERAVRAGLIRFLLLGGDEEHRPHPKGIVVVGAWIEGALDLQGCETHLDLSLYKCLLPEEPVFRDAQIGGLYLSGSRAPAGCDLQRVVVESNVFLNSGFHATGTVDLAGAAITGQLACNGGRFERPGGVALNANAATVGADVFLCDGFHATGAVNVVRATITGQLACGGGRFERPGGVALDAGGVTVGADLFLRDGFHATGEVHLVRAAITGQLACNGGRFERPGGVALNANAATVGADVFLRDGFHATGEVNVVRATVTGQLACDGGRFERPGGVALDAGGATVGADVFLRDGFHADGSVDLRRARIEGNLHVQRARIEGMVILHSARVGDGFYWQDVWEGAIGVDLTEAKVGALHDDLDSWARVAAGLRLEGFRYAALHGDLSPQDRLAWLDRCRKPLLPGPAARLGPVMPFLPAAGARAFSPQPYSQLARVLISQGRRGAAATVLFERERRLRETEWLRYQAKLDGSWGAAFRSLVGEGPRFAGLCFQWLFGFGHRPWRALISVAPYWSLATLFFWSVYDAGEFAPNSDVVLTSADWHRAVHLGCPLSGAADFTDRKAAGCVMPQEIWTSGLPEAVPPVPASTAAGDYETFSAGLYAADLFLPLDTIGQTEAWAPSKDRGAWGAAGYWARFPIQLFGWIMVAMAAAVLTGVIGKKEE